jgi:hypothetical protein
MLRKDGSSCSTSGTPHVAISTICKTMSIAYKLSKTITYVALHNNRTINCTKNILVLWAFIYH